MVAFADVVLRALLLVWLSVAAGGVAWVRLVLRAGPHAKPDPAAAASLRLVAVAGGLAAATQAAAATLILASVQAAGAAAWLETTFARVALARVALAVALAVLAARLGRRPAGRAAWLGLVAMAAALVASSAALSHAAARVEGRLLPGLLDALHQLAAAVWVGGLAHLTLLAVRSRREPRPALGAVAALVTSGLGLGALWIGGPAAMVGTAYGVMVASKVALLLAALGLAWVNLRVVRRRAVAAGRERLARYVEVELGLAVTVLFAAASLTSLPPGVDVQADRAAPAEVAARFRPAAPRLTSPPLDELLRTADPLMAPPGGRKPVERAWSEYNHRRSESWEPSRPGRAGWRCGCRTPAGRRDGSGGDASPPSALCC